MSHSLQEYLNIFAQPEHLSALTNIGRGIEREALRVLPEGKLSDTPHHEELGSALTHPSITTDYSEALLEFITPVSTSPETAIAQLQDIQKYTLSVIGDELLWPLSMPCFVDDEDKIAIAQYGSSNVGKMKTTYRQGLKNRYGSMMQVISGIHFNFSFSEDFWSTLKKIDSSELDQQAYISNGYFKLLRNYKKYCWLIPYLYGSSPILCPSFLQGNTQTLPFKKSSSGALYLEYATSLRMSDLGYTNSEQSSLHICYNDLEGYVEGVREAINLPSTKFEKIGVKENGVYHQLNSNVLQIENELYAPIRPKRVAKSGEKPSEALSERGVEYIEVRALDVNPFVDTGISLEQVYFLDVFLTFCALKEHEYLSCEQQQQLSQNMDKVVVEGRDPALKLIDDGVEKSIPQWGGEIFEELAMVAEILDQAYETKKYSQCVSEEYKKVVDSSLTPSAQMVSALINDEGGMSNSALNKATEYKSELLARDYQFYDLAYFEESSKTSHLKQKEIEASDVLSFDAYLENYFAES